MWGFPATFGAGRGSQSGHSDSITLRYFANILPSAISGLKYKSIIRKPDRKAGAQSHGPNVLVVAKTTVAGLPELVPASKGVV